MPKKLETIIFFLKKDYRIWINYTKYKERRIQWKCCHIYIYIYIYIIKINCITIVNNYKVFVNDIMISFTNFNINDKLTTNFECFVIKYIILESKMKF